MLIFGLNLSSRRKKRFPGIDDVIVARPCHWSTSADRFVDMTLKQVLTPGTRALTGRWWCWLEHWGQVGGSEFQASHNTPTGALV